MLWSSVGFYIFCCLVSLDVYLVLNVLRIFSPFCNVMIRAIDSLLGGWRGTNALFKVFAHDLQETCKFCFLLLTQRELALAQERWYVARMQNTVQKVTILIYIWSSQDNLKSRIPPVTGVRFTAAPCSTSSPIGLLVHILWTCFRFFLQSLLYLHITISIFHSVLLYLKFHISVVSLWNPLFTSRRFNLT